MKKIFTIIALVTISIFANAQPTPQLPNESFETWMNSGTSITPTDYYSNKTGTGWASVGPQTCFQDATGHTGSYSAQIITGTALGNAVNGAMTSGLVNAPTTSKADGYIGTIQGANGTTVNHIAFNGRPDSLVGWYQYTQSTTTTGTGGGNETGKVRAIVHLGNYYDPETPSNSNHPDSSANKIGDALFLTPASNVGSWTRFSVPFNYVSSATPQYIMLNCTSSSNQLTTVAGSTLLLDDIAVIYNPSTAGIKTVEDDKSIQVYAFDKVMYIDFLNRNAEASVISVFDLSGKLVVKQQLSNNQLNSINMSEYNSGLYLYELTGNGFNKSEKLLIK